MAPPPSLAPADSDETLLVRFRKGDEAAFAELYGRHRGGLYRFIRGLCASLPPSTADEIFQDTWLALIRTDTVPDGRARFKTWLFQMARHRLVDCWRKQKGAVVEVATPDYNGHSTGNTAGNALDNAVGNTAEHALGEGEGGHVVNTPETWVLRAEQLQQLAEAIDTLPLPQREVFLLRAHADMALADIAALTQTPLEAVKSRYRYALVKLRQRLLAPTPTPGAPLTTEAKTPP